MEDKGVPISISELIMVEYAGEVRVFDKGKNITYRYTGEEKTKLITFLNPKLNTNGKH